MSRAEVEETLICLASDFLKGKMKEKSEKLGELVASQVKGVRGPGSCAGPLPLAGGTKAPGSALFLCSLPQGSHPGSQFQTPSIRQPPICFPEQASPLEKARPAQGPWATGGPGRGKGGPTQSHKPPGSTRR